MDCNGRRGGGGDGKLSQLISKLSNAGTVFYGRGIGYKFSGAVLPIWIRSSPLQAVKNTRQDMAAPIILSSLSVHIFGRICL